MQSVFTSPLPCLLAEGVSASSDRREGGGDWFISVHRAVPDVKQRICFFFLYLLFLFCLSFMLTLLLMQSDASPVGDVSSEVNKTLGVKAVTPNQLVPHPDRLRRLCLDAGTKCHGPL